MEIKEYEAKLINHQFIFKAIFTAVVSLFVFLILNSVFSHSSKLFLPPFAIVAIFLVTSVFIIVINFLSKVILRIEGNTLLIKRADDVAYQVPLNANLKIKIQNKLNASDKTRRFDYLVHLTQMGIDKPYTLRFIKEDNRDLFVKDLTNTAGLKFDDIEKDKDKIADLGDVFKVIKGIKENNSVHAGIISGEPIVQKPSINFTQKLDQQQVQPFTVKAEDKELFVKILRVGFVTLVVFGILYYVIVLK